MHGDVEISIDLKDEIQEEKTIHHRAAEDIQSRLEEEISKTYVLNRIINGGELWTWRRYINNSFVSFVFLNFTLKISAPPPHPVYFMFARFRRANSVWAL